jgi:ACS family glucarate transporter-like MFS transporter
MDHESIAIKRTATRIPSRYLLVALTFLLSLLLYIDRVNISAAKESIAASLSLTDKQFGWVISAFALGYALFQTPGGLLADRFGPRLVLTSVVSFWSLFTGLTAAARNLLAMLAVRFLFGRASAAAFPTMPALLLWIPMKERGRAGASRARSGRPRHALVAWMITVLGWRGTFVFWSVVGFGWAMVWYLWFRNDPAEHPRISPAELEHIRQNRQQARDDKSDQPKLSASVMLRSRNMWLAMVQYFCSNFTFFFALTWLFPHMKQTYQLGRWKRDLHRRHLYSRPWAWLPVAVDRIYRQNRWVLSRRAPAMAGFALAALGLVISVYMHHPLTAVVFFSLALFGADMTLPPSWALCIDIGRKHSGAVSGTMNMAGNIGSFVTGLAFPYLRTGPARSSRSFSWVQA